MDKIENESNNKPKKRTLQKATEFDTMKRNNLPAMPKGDTMAGTKRKDKRKDTNRKVLRKGESQRKNGTYVYSWTDKESGKRRSVYAPTLEELREKEQQLLEDAVKGINRDGSNKTVNDLYDEWISLKKNLQPSTRNSYIQNYELHVRNTLGKKKAKQAKQNDIRRFYIGMLDGGNQGLSVVNVIHTVLSQVFKMAVDNNYISKNPAAGAKNGLENAYPPDPSIRVLTFEQQRQIFAFMKNQPKFKNIYDLLFVMVCTGMRAGEVMALQWDDIDFNMEYIHVNHAIDYLKIDKGDGEKFQYSMHAPKTKTSCRSITMLPMVREVLLDRRFGEEYNRKVDKPVDGYDNFVFLNQNNKPYTIRMVNRYLHVAIEAYNNMENKGPDWISIPMVSSHALRHSFATRMCEAGVNMKVTQTMLGHKDIQTTMNTYTSVTEVMQDEAKGRMSAYLQGAAPQLTTNLPQIYL